MNPSLFLHMGPGFHARIENALFSKKHPNILFWNQPEVTTFDDLINAAHEKVLELFKKNSMPIGLIAHSFGGQIAKEITQRDPKKISSLYLINAAYDPFECFLNLKNHIRDVTVNSFDSDQLRAASPDDKIQFIISLSSSSHFQSLYWHSQENFKKYSEIFSNYPPLNPIVFINIFKSYLTQRDSSKNQSPINISEVKLHYSKHDLLLNKEKDIDPWKIIYPNCEFIISEKSGHYLYLEDLFF